MPSPKNIRIEDYKYDLPDDRIAKYPLKDRDKCKLLIYKDKQISEGVFSDVGELLGEDTLMVINDTKVIPARLEFHTPNGARVEIFCLEPHLPADYDSNFASRSECQWKCLAGNLKRWKDFPLSREIPCGGSTSTLTAQKMQADGGEVIAKFSWDGGHSFSEIIDAAGSIPIPPYLNRKAEDSDTTDYQTVYSQYKGSVAAPTAGLHFSPALMQGLRCEVQRLTLHVGAGTFKPVKTETIGEHEMHREFFSVTRGLLLSLLSHPGRIAAVGTTSVRTLESLYWLGLRAMRHEPLAHLPQWECYEADGGGIPAGTALRALIAYLDANNTDTLKASTGIMICPGYRYRIVNKIITNFHQPESTLLLLVSAAIGGAWKDVYEYAMDHGFRFLSYGDSCFLEVRAAEN